MKGSIVASVIAPLIVVGMIAGFVLGKVALALGNVTPTPRPTIAWSTVAVPSLTGVRVPTGQVVEIHEHEWVKGPFYIKAASGFEEPTYYPPSALIQIEHCKLCGQLRLPREMWGVVGENLELRLPNKLLIPGREKP